MKKLPLSPPGGNAVYRARGMYALVADAAYNDADACAIQGLQYKNAPAAATTFSFIPNPATNEVRLCVPESLQKEANLYLYNTLGQQVLNMPMQSRQTEMRISIQHLPTGLYYAVVKQQDRTVLTQKLSIIH